MNHAITRHLIAACTWLRDNSLEIGAGFFLGVSATFGVATVVGRFL